MRCGFLFSKTWKSSFVKSGTKRPFFVRDREQHVHARHFSPDGRRSRILIRGRGRWLLRLGKTQRADREDGGSEQGNGPELHGNGVFILAVFWRTVSRKLANSCASGLSIVTASPVAGKRKRIFQACRKNLPSGG